MLVGDWHLSEFAASLDGIPSAKSWQSFADLQAVAEFLSDSAEPPELVFLTQPLPDAYEQAEVDRLQQRAPLSRIVVVAGTWCEGELRTGKPLSGVIRLYWYELASWWQAAARRRDAGLCPLWSQPLDQSQAGRWSSANQLAAANKTNNQVCIDASDYAVYESLSAALKAFSIDAAWAGRELEGADKLTQLGIWDGGQLSAREITRLASFCSKINGPVVALLDFPRVEHFEQARAVGATAVLAKPYIVEELVAALLG